MPLDAARLAEIDAQRAEQHPTRRVTVAALEELLYQPLPVLDHGFIRVIDYMGDDAAIVQAARVSYGRGTRHVSNDRGLINYLLRHRHTSPLEMCEIKLHVKLPIFVARQWIRHRTANVNEYSARYSILDREFYLPDRELLMSNRRELNADKVSEEAPPMTVDLFAHEGAVARQSRENRQGRDEPVEAWDHFAIADRIKRESERAHTFYAKLLNERPDGSVIDAERPGIARELARMVLPLNTYTQMYWKIDLNNLLHFVRLRADRHAQHEIRLYAERLIDILRLWVPLTLAAFEEYRLAAAELSGKAVAVLRARLRGEVIEPIAAGLGTREWNELLALFPELAESPSR